MQKFIFFLLTFGIAAYFSCTKEDQKAQVQSHDENKIMQSLHDMTDSIDTVSWSNGLEIDFFGIMEVVHHGALHMADIMFHQGKNEKLMEIAKEITLVGHAQLYDSIDLKLITVKIGDSEFNAEVVHAMEQMSNVADLQFITGDLDNDYATLMIPHHQFAIAICKAYLKLGADPYMQRAVQRIINTHNAEILELSDWLIDNKRH